jgi:hypothetical protein
MARRPSVPLSGTAIPDGQIAPPSTPPLAPMTAHDMKVEARAVLGWEASDDDVTLGAIVLTLKRLDMNHATIRQLIGMVEHLTGDLRSNLPLHLEVAVHLANRELAQQQRGA